MTDAAGSTWSSSAAASSASPRRTRWRAPAARSRSWSASRGSRPIRRATTPTSSTPGSTTRPAATRPASPSPAARRPSPSAARTTCRARSPASWSSPPSPTSCPGSPSSSGAATRTASRATSWTRPACASTSRTCRGLRAAVRAVDRGHRLPGDRREARRAGAEGRRRDPARPGGPQRRAASRRRRRSARDGGDLLGTQVVVCAGLRCDELARRVGRRPRRADHPVPRRVLRVRRARRRGWSSGLIYPVPDPAFPFLGVHATRGDRRQRARRPERRARARPRGLLVGRGEAQELLGSLAYPGMLRLARQHWRYGLGEMHRSLSREAMVRRIAAAAARRPGRRPAPGRRRGAGPGGPARTAPWSTTSCSSPRADGASGAVLHVLNAPSPAATAALPIGREILETLTGERLRRGTARMLTRVPRGPGGVPLRASPASSAARTPASRR